MHLVCDHCHGCMERESRSREKRKEANLMLYYCCWAAHHWFGIIVGSSAVCDSADSQLCLSG